ncbi:MAG: flagellar basal body rod C-terminal domain-containing protein [Pseudomonadota bacterium]
MAARLGVNDAVNPDEGGDLWRLRDGINATGPGASAGIGVVAGLVAAVDETRVLASVTDTPAALSLNETAAAFASVVGTQRIDASAAAAAASSTAQSLRDEELSVTGVNTDQELQSLLLIEQAYAANARVVQVVNEMMARLLEI